MILSNEERQKQHSDWADKHHAPLDIDQHADALLALFSAVRAAGTLSPTKLTQLIDQCIRADAGPVSRDKIIDAYKRMTERGTIPFERDVFERLRLVPVRTLSGVAPLAVLTGAYPCPAECIFCPEVRGFPKSYLPDEPGAQRAAFAHFDPFKQTATRLRGFENVGHATDKIELLILGATWSAYPHKYQEWFIRRCFDALNGADSASLADAQKMNETAAHRNVGLVIETRPDYIDMTEGERLRSLGVTKVQLGAQSLDDRILALNKRGHNVGATRRAVRLLRLAGFKLHLHWMPNLLGATPESDRADFRRLWDDPALRPDEIKIYPCSLIEGTELFAHYQRGREAYRPYTDDELIELLIDCKTIVPPYCRINRVIRDIPANYIAAGSTASHLRVVVQREMKQRGLQCQCIRCREVRSDKVDADALRLEAMTYATDATTEHFLSCVTPRGKVAGFLRLSLPAPNAPRDELLDELRGSAVIREVHVYGPALEIGESSRGEAQHAGLGTRLIDQAMQIALGAGYRRIAVISAIGTREYYRKHGFELGELYMARAVDG
ncbi:MAG: tRNA uridine(34) 5-carboxymethylaminomethyl modification radical SAM/GNAT enzyme Elp3 [Chloroflexota bacterium]|nr:tRNA uridine(34) 5-carboxymethylaminomethyl modification radical SAM/GNAT enzyme Elp3 [Chloroflexota bacterium]